ncbi:hypothetical protein BGZ90_006538 [Linnemannia elongata]|nr:hypothetical protein BGZ90_006538 [Linnemannia elongata]
MDLSPETDLDAEQAHLYQHCLRILAKDTPTQLEQKQLLVTAIDAATLPTTEAEYVALWKDTLETLSEGKLKLRSGETICNATAVQKRSSISLWNTANDTESGRKVDLILQVDGVEVMNIEAKRGQDLIQAESQYSKNLRINQAIYLAARQRGIVLETIPFLDIRGCTGLVCVLTKKQDSSVFMGGLACQQVIELPVRLDDIVDFMSKGGGLQTLTRFVDIVLKFQESLQ